MKQLILIALLAVSGWGTTYYIDATNGNDGASGTSTETAWKTIAKIEASAATLNPGDTIRFKRGEIWRDQLDWPENGTAAAYYVVGAYGSLSDGYPVISGADDISYDNGFEWHLSANGTGEYYCTGASGADPSLSSPTYVWVDDIRYPEGTVGSLDLYQFDYANNDGLAFNTIYVRTGGNPAAVGVTIELKKRSNCIYTQRTYCSFDSLQLEKADYNIRVVLGKNTFTNCRFYRGGSLGLINVMDSCFFIANEFKEQYASAYGIRLTGTDGKCVIAYNLFTGFYSNALDIDGDSLIYIFGNTFVGNRNNSIILNNSACSLYIYNNTFSGVGAADYTSANAARRSAGAVKYDYNNTLPNGLAPGTMLNGIVEGANCINEDPGFIKTRRRGFFCLTMDDWITGLNYYNTNKSHFFTNGVGWTYNIHRTDLIPSADWDALQTGLNSGFLEVGLHTRGHVDLTQDTAFNIQYVGAGSACAMTITVDYGARTGTLTTTVTGAPEDNLSIDFGTVKRIGNATADMVKQINDHANYTCGLQDSYNYFAKTITLKAVVGQDIKTAVYYAMFDTSAYYKEEIDSCKLDIENRLTDYTVRSMAYPGGYYNDAVINRLFASKLQNGRTVTIVTTNYNKINPYTLTQTDAGLGTTLSDAEVKKRVLGILTSLDYSGGIITDLQHQDVDYKYSVICPTIANYTGRTAGATQSQAVDYVRANGITFDSLTWYVAPEDSSDYRLKSTSLLVGAGDATILAGIPNLRTIDGVQITDASGVILVNSVNIGAYGVLNEDTPPTITVQPQSDSIALGSDVVLSVTATGSTPMAYVWQYWSGSWQDSGEAKYINSFTVNDVNTISTYRVIVTNPFGEETSESAVITPVPPPVITVQPVDQYTVIGNTAEFTVEATGTGTLSYQWQNNYEGWVDIEHETLSTKQVPNVTLGVDSVSFRCIISDAYGADTSDSATLYVGTFPEITVQPVSDSVYNWKNAYLTIGATGTEPIVKTWQKRNGEWQTVNTGDSLTVIPLDTMTTYRVLISSPWGANTSDTANITFFEPVSRRYSWIDSTLTASGLTVPDSGNVGAKINNVNLTLTKWSGGQVIGTVPSGTPAGLYKSPGLWLYQFTGGDTTAIDTLGAVRVLQFRVRSVE